MTARDRGFNFGPFRLVPNQRLLLRDGVPLSIGGRSLDILLTLLARRDRIVEKEELKRIVWSTSLVADHNLAVHISNLRKLLETGSERYIATISGRGYRFISIVEETDDQPTTRAVLSAEGNLPLPLSRSIGRDREIDELSTIVGLSRLTTIVGTGGIGKTHLALEAGQRLRPMFPDGIWFIELATMAPDDLSMAIATALHSDLIGSDGLDGIVRYLGGRQALLILDSCEHLLDSVARACETILKACAAVRIIVTSREPLRAEGERLLWLQGLSVPPPTPGLTRAEAESFSAIRLLLERSSYVTDMFELTDANVAAVAAICRRLDGMPLALELAAPLFRMVTPEELLLRLEDRFAIIAGSRRTGLARQQTLKATIDWSYDQLIASEQLALRRLSVFAGAWTIDAATAVISGEPLDLHEIPLLVASLADKSLLSVDVAGDRPIYRLLQTTRQYVLEKREELGEPDLRGRLAAWLTSRGQDADALWQALGDQAFLDRCSPDLEDMRSVLSWCFGVGGNPALGVELVSVSYSHWSAHSALSERRHWFDRALTHLTPMTPDGIAARVLYGASFRGDLRDPSALDLALRAVGLFRQVDDRVPLARALVRTAIASMDSFRLAQVPGYLAEAETHLPAGLSRVLVVWHLAMGEYQFLTGRLGIARQVLLRAGQVARELDSPSLFLDVEVSLAEVDFKDGSPERAAMTIQQALEVFSDVSDQYDGKIRARSNLASYLLALGRQADARNVSLQVLEAARIHEMGSAALWMIERCALIHAMAGNAQRAAALLGYTSIHLTILGMERRPTEAYILEKLLLLLKAALSPLALGTALLEGGEWPEERAFAEAQSI